MPKQSLNFREGVAYGLLFSFLALTVWHTQHVLAHFEEIKEMAWLLAVGLDAGIAFASFVALDVTVIKWSRIVAGVWLGGLIIASYGINTAYYIGENAEGWSWALAALFPASLAFLGAIIPGLKSINQNTIGKISQPNYSENLPLAKPTTTGAKNGKTIAPAIDQNMPVLANHSPETLPMAKMPLPIIENGKTDQTRTMPFAKTEELPNLKFGKAVALENMPFDQNWQSANPILTNEQNGKVLRFPADGNPQSEIDSRLDTDSDDSTSLQDQIGKAVRLVQQKKLGVKDFDLRLLQLWAETAMSPESSFPAEICRLARLVQQREIGVKDFDRKLAELLAQVEKE
jgi:hypothetical protein